MFISFCCCTLGVLAILKVLTYWIPVLGIVETHGTLRALRHGVLEPFEIVEALALWIFETVGRLEILMGLMLEGFDILVILETHVSLRIRGMREVLWILRVSTLGGIFWMIEGFKAL